MALARGFDGCIDVYPPEEWGQVSRQVKSFSRYNRDARLLRRLTLGNAFMANMDKQGRVPLPAWLRQHAAIAEEVVITGQDNYIEVWASERWAQQESQGGQMADIAERLEQLRQPDGEAEA